jgi:hypothetical protein
MIAGPARRATGVGSGRPILPGMRWWKAVGLAGVAGVAATGVVLARAERQRRAYTPDEIRARLHERAEVALPREPDPGPAPPSAR